MAIDEVPDKQLPDAATRCGSTVARVSSRSRLWDPDSWTPGAVPSRPRIAKTLERPDDSLSDIEHYYGPTYLTRLYRP